MSKKLKITLLKIIVTVIVFLLALKIASAVMNRQEEMPSAKMSEPSFPVVSLSFQDIELNRMNGYANEMDTVSMRGPVYLTDKSRACKAIVETYGQEAEDFFYELRTTDGVNLIEKTRIDSVEKMDDSKLELSFILKDLIDYDTQYMLAIIIRMHEGREIRFYSRVICSADEELMNLEEHLSFVTKFHEMTFEKDRGAASYLESKSGNKEQTYSYVDITSPFEYVSWEGLNITSKEAPQIAVYDVHGQTASISLDYMLTISENDRATDYHVTEKYFTRYANGKMYLIDYRRTMDSIFNPDSPSFKENMLDFSYCNTEPPFKESETGTGITFVNAGRLYAWQLADNRLTEVISFYTPGDDARIRSGSIDIDVLRMDETGNVTFCVTGYFSRGEHEGEVGTAVYEFDAACNYITEYVFIPSPLSEEILMQTSGRFQYKGNDGSFYTLQGDSLYRISIYNGESTLIVENATAKNLSISESGSVIAWQNAEDDVTAGITLMDLNDARTENVSFESGEGVRLLTFLGDDLVYGYVKKEDIKTGLVGDALYPCYRLSIMDREGNIITSYNSEGKYVYDAVAETNRVVLKRVEKNMSGDYVVTEDDAVMSSEEETSGINQVLRVKGDKGDVICIDLHVPVSMEKCRRFDAEITGKVAFVPETESLLPAGRFIAYDQADVTGVYKKPSLAVSEAYKLCGQVVDERGEYVYYRGNLTRKNQIMSLTKAVEGRDFSGMNTLDACLSVMLEFEGAAADLSSLREKGLTIRELLVKALPVATVLDLNGCPLQAMTYYLDLMCDYPVLAAVSDTEYVLLIGFNDTEVVVFDPSKPSGNVYKLNMKEAARMFLENGNRFITYVK